LPIEASRTLPCGELMIPAPGMCEIAHTGDGEAGLLWKNRPFIYEDSERTNPEWRNTMRLSVLRRAATLIVVFAALGTSACFGSFNLTRKLYGFNKGVSNEKFVRELVFLGLNIVPVYGAAGFIDAVVVNTVEFWSGKNPIEMASRTRLDSVTTVSRVMYEKDGARVMSLKTFKFDKLVSATTVQYVPGEDHMTFKTTLSGGQTATNVVRMRADGTAYVASSQDVQR
jgi:hypothetical protein